MAGPFCASATPNLDFGQIDGDWTCERSYIGAEPGAEASGSFDLAIRDNVWQTRVDHSEGYTYYNGHATYSGEEIKAVFETLENFGSIGEEILKRQTDAPLPITVNYLLFDVRSDGFRLETKYTQLNCLPMQKEDQ